jgi:hypothetical protein
MLLQRRFGLSVEEAEAKLKSSTESERFVVLMWSMILILVFDRPGTFEDGLTTIRSWDSLFSLISARDVEKAIHGVICEYLHLDATRCRQNGVRPIFSRWHGVVQPGGEEEGMSSQSCVGLVNGQLFDQAISSGAELLTIAHRGSPETPCYEAVMVSETSPPEYRIIGVWVPLHEKFQVAEVGAIMVHLREEHNAYVV